MSNLRIYPLLLIVALALTGCSVAAGASSGLADGGPTMLPLPTVAPSTSTPLPAAVATPSPSAEPSSTSVGSTAASSDPAIAAIQAVIQKANQEQQDAFAKSDPTIMKDTATSAYYDQLVQINNDMARGGVSDIKLVKIEWGPIKLTSPTTAQATTFETWRVTFTDGSLDQSREQNDYVLVLEQGSWKIQSDENPATSPSQPGGSSASAPTTVIPAPASTPASQADLSRNWAGYAATSGTFTAASGTWTVPQSGSTGGVAAGATWVGIGGVQTRDLIQAGTMETTTGTGTVHYNAWVETLPQAARPVPFTVSPGDSVTVSISEQSTNQWLIEFKNGTSGEDYRTTLHYASSKSSAEWIEEAPSSGRRILPISNFGTVQFSGGSAVQNGKTVTIEQSGAQPITLAGNSSGAVVTPSVLTPDGQGFSVTWSASTPGLAPHAGRRSAP